ncbi:DUF2304 domain-containing protein [Cellulosimicrobium sp. PMB13]|uniref:DUF2304 family protein n=1 Tax=Cellulosimicrobium sp. PMB13 TaxID=3120158 RepID=UPI003F4B6CDF
MNTYYLALAVVVALVIFLVVLLRTRRLKEKYAAAWLLLAVAVSVVGAFPSVVSTIAAVLGVATPSNLLFAAALAVLLGVCIQLSVELTTLEEETRTLAEELAMLRLDLERRTGTGVTPPSAPSTGAVDVTSSSASSAPSAAETGA